MSGTVLEKMITFGQSMKNPSGTYNGKGAEGGLESGGDCNGARCEKKKMDTSSSGFCFHRETERLWNRLNFFFLLSTSVSVETSFICCIFKSRPGSEFLRHSSFFFNYIFLFFFDNQLDFPNAN